MVERCSILVVMPYSDLPTYILGLKFALECGNGQSETKIHNKEKFQIFGCW